VSVSNVWVSVAPSAPLTGRVSSTVPAGSVVRATSTSVSGSATSSVRRSGRPSPSMSHSTDGLVVVPTSARSAQVTTATAIVPSAVRVIPA
jgi:hypothetical protein